jgi:predicted GTPase
MIVVMGVTGAGKSYFINSLAGRPVVEVGNTLDPCMSQ